MRKEGKKALGGRLIAHLKLVLLGSFQCSLGSEPVLALRSDQGRGLLAYLAVEADRAHRRDHLVGLLWPNSPEVNARHNLRQVLFGLRRTLQDAHAQKPFLLVHREEIRFNPASDCDLDVAEFNAHLAAVQQHNHTHLADCAICAARLEQAAELYRGKFLQEFFLADSGEFEEWALVQRESLHQRALRALAQLADYCEMHGDLSAARAHALRQLELDPWREQAHARLIRLYALEGDRAAATAQYETCRHVLAEELGVEPSEETRTLYEQIADEKYKPPANSPAQPASSNLPSQLTPFIGRAQEQAELAHMLADPSCRLLTLVGPGGIGKTRLALQLAGHCRSMFPQEIAFIPLASTPSSELIAPAICAALGLVSHNPGKLKPQLLTFLHEREMLLILDNLEHLSNSGDLLIELLQNAPRIKLLATSREPLALREEFVYDVKGLAIPASAAEEMEQFDAVVLFIERARRAHASFRLTEEDKAAVVRLCQLLDGAPLALELAAAWVRTLTIAEIVQEIERNLDFLSATWRGLPERQRSLRAVFDYSWARLSADEQKVLSWLAVFRRNFHRRAAESVAQASLPILASLVAKSFIRRRGTKHPGRTRSSGQYEMHELVRHYAEERLIERGEQEAACRAHFRYFLQFAEGAAPKLVGNDQVAWLDQLEEEHHNLRGALEWSLKRTESMVGTAGEDSLRLVNALTIFWVRREHWSEGRAWLTRALSRTLRLPATLARAQALDAAVILAVEQADTAAATSLAEENLALASKLGDPLRTAWALNSYAFLLWKKKDYLAAQAQCEKGLVLFRHLGHAHGIAESLHGLGHLAINQNHPAAAQEYLEASLVGYRKIGDVTSIDIVMGDLGLVSYLQGQDTAAWSYLEQALSGARKTGSIATTEASLNRLGDLARRRADYAEAGKLYTECLELYRRMGDRDEIPSLLHNLGYVERARGNYNQALALFREALSIQREMENRAGIAECLEGIGAVWTQTGSPVRGAHLLGAAEVLRQQAGASLWPANQIEHERNVAALRSMMSPAALEDAWVEGRQKATDDSFLDSLFL